LARLSSSFLFCFALLCFPSFLLHSFLHFPLLLAFTGFSLISLLSPSVILLSLDFGRRLSLSLFVVAFLYTLRYSDTITTRDFLTKNQKSSSHYLCLCLG
jgi:hypothetical protein